MKPTTHLPKAPAPTGAAATAMSDAVTPRAWVLYDADCRFCTKHALRYKDLLARRNFALLPLQTPWIRERFPDLNDADYLAEMRLLFPDGKKFGGADALIEIARHYWWAWPVFALGHIPPIHALLRAAYRRIARNRDCATNACTIHIEYKKARLTFADFLPLLALPLLALLFKTQLVPWVFMWLMAVAIFAGCKWLTYRNTAKNLSRVSLPRTVGYLFLWPGMDANKFLRPEFFPALPRPAEWLVALLKTGFGTLLLWGVARTALPAHPMLAGWIAMTGIIFILHFGLFHLLSLAWRTIGVEAPPIMNRPLLAVSLAEFWGKRWNTAFNTLAFQFAFRPLRSVTNAIVATLAVFFISGVAHELAISLPANGGYGLPTAYFLIQGLGMIIERTNLGRRMGLGRGLRGWIFTALITVAPAYWLFHPPFIKNVILPMLPAIGAT